MNPKHAKLLRRARTHYIARILNATPEGTSPAMTNVLRAADALVKMVQQNWERLNVTNRGHVGMLLERCCDASITNFNLSDLAAMMVRS